MVEPGGGCLPTNLSIPVSRSWRQESDNNTYLYNFTIASLNTNFIHMRTRIHAHDARTRMRAVS